MPFQIVHTKATDLEVSPGVPLLGVDEVGELQKFTINKHTLEEHKKNFLEPQKIYIFFMKSH